MTEHDSGIAASAPDTKRTVTIRREVRYRAILRTIGGRFPWCFNPRGGAIKRAGLPVAAAIGRQGERRRPAGGRVTTAGVA